MTFYKKYAIIKVDKYDKYYILSYYFINVKFGSGTTKPLPPIRFKQMDRVLGIPVGGRRRAVQTFNQPVHKSLCAGSRLRWSGTWSKRGLHKIYYVNLFFVQNDEILGFFCEFLCNFFQKKFDND